MGLAVAALVLIVATTAATAVGPSVAALLGVASLLGITATSAVVTATPAVGATTKAAPTTATAPTTAAAAAVAATTSAEAAATEAAAALALVEVTAGSALGSSTARPAHLDGLSAAVRRRLDFELDGLAITEATEPISDDVRLVHEVVRTAVVRGNETVSLDGVEPLYGSSCLRFSHFAR